MELGAEVNIRWRSPQVGAEVTRAEHRLPQVRNIIYHFEKFKPFFVEIKNCDGQMSEGCSKSWSKW